jgi:hypothetical protein
LPGERDVAESVLADRPVVPDRKTVGLPSGTLTIDLRRNAEAETAWIHQARALGAQTTSAVTSTRPVIARVRNRSRRTMPARGVWLFRLAVVGADGHPIWESLVPLAGDLAGLRGRPDTVRRTALDPGHSAIQELLGRTSADRLGELQGPLDDALQKWHVREQTLMDAIRARHARLSADLMQRGLFDGRTDRLAAAQAVLMDRALAQSHERVAELAACGRLRLDGCDLVFAAVFE